MKIAVLDPSNFTPPYDQSLVMALKAQGADVRLLGRAVRLDDPVDINLVQPEAFFFGYSELLRGKLPKSIYLCLKAVEHLWQTIFLPNYLWNEGFTLVHFQWTPIPLLDQFTILRMKKKLPVIITVHDLKLFHGNASSKLQTIGWRRVLLSADQVIVHTKGAAKCLQSIGRDADRVHYIPHPVFDRLCDVKESGPLSDVDREKLGLSQSKTNFLLFGRLAPYKGLETVLDAVAGLSPEDRRCIRVVLAGTPAFDLVAYKKELQRLGLEESIRIVPRFLSAREIDNYLTIADVVIFPYVDIDASGALMQALPYKPTVIASDVGVFSELLTNNKNAVLISPGSATALRAAMISLSKDSDYRRRLSTEIGELVDDALSWKTAAAATMRVYKQASNQVE